MKHIIFALLCLTSISSVLAQADLRTKLQDYLPPSPEAQEFIKYGEYPVGMYTGVPNISIPIYGIQVKDINVPISLSYHASGIQVDQIASWVGLGWSLNAGGMISVVPRGTPDTDSNGYLLTDVPEINELVYDSDYYEDVATGKRETESDIYHYNFAGYSGKFFFDRDKNVRLIEEVPIKINYIPSTPGIPSKFIITTQMGVVYEFNDVESTQTISYSQGNPTGLGTEQSYVSAWHLSKIIATNKIDIVNFTYEAVNSFSTNQYSYSESTGNKLVIESVACPIGGGTGQTVVLETNVHDFGALSSQTQSTQNPKRLKEIVFPNGKMEFIRAADRLDAVLDRLKEVIIYKKNGIIYDQIKRFDFIHDHFESNQTTVFPPSPSPTRKYRLKLDELHEYDNSNSEAKKHVFGYNSSVSLPPVGTNGKDYWGYYNGADSNTTLIPLQQFQYFGNNVGSADRKPDGIAMQAAILNKITYPTKGYTEFLYEPHDYITTEADVEPKVARAFAVGQEGVIGNGIPYEHEVVITPNISGYATLNIEASDLSSVTGTFPTVTLQRAGDSGFMIYHSIDPSTYSPYPPNPLKVEETFPPVWLDEGVSYTLKSVAVGTSLSTEFDGAAYMDATLDYFEEVINPVPVTKIAGGLRIQQIKSFGSNNELAFSKRYEYNAKTLITPESFIKEQYLDIENELTVSSCGVSCSGLINTRRFYYGGTVQSLTLNGGSPVLYSSVDEYRVDEFNNNLGKTNYTYAVQTDDVLPVPSAYQGGIMLLKKDWMGGQNIATTTYHRDATAVDDYITSQTNGHTIKRYDESYKMYKIIHVRQFSGCFAPNPARYALLEYPIFRGTKLVNSSQTITKYENGEELTNSTSIFYDNETHLQPTRTETTTSDGKIVYKQTYYPEDITNTASLGASDLLNPDEYAAIESLKSQKDDGSLGLHRVAEPIQVETTVDGDKTIQRTNYRIWQGINLTLPEFVQTKKGSKALDDRLHYRQYDAKGNPLEASKTSGAPIAYIWGYDKMFPVAKIENATYEDIENLAGFGSGFDLGEDGLSTTQENTLRTQLPNSMVTTYIYDPLIGVTTMTDPKGYTTNYYYDNFNRLKEVRDQDNNLVSDYQYHYKN